MFIFPLSCYQRAGSRAKHFEAVVSIAALEYTIRWVPVNQDSLKFNGTHQLLVYAYDVYILGGSIHTTKENAEALVVASKEIGLEANADKTKYMVMS